VVEIIGSIFNILYLAYLWLVKAIYTVLFERVEASYGIDWRVTYLALRLIKQIRS
jgi:hypothetical protein